MKKTRYGGCKRQAAQIFCGPLFRLSWLAGQRRTAVKASFVTVRRSRARPEERFHEPAPAVWGSA